MPVRCDTTGSSIRLTASELTPAVFAPFGDVVENPRRRSRPEPGGGGEYDAVAANQGSATKYRHVSRPRDLYAAAPSRRPSAPEMNLFACAARPLQPEPGGGLFSVRILERHPFTSQTFIPLVADPAARYLVIVAPTLSPQATDPGLPSPSPSSTTAASRPHHPGSGLPDLKGLRAFLASGSQAVTYAAGTWHAPSMCIPFLLFFPVYVPRVLVQRVVSCPCVYIYIYIYMCVFVCVCVGVFSFA